MNPPFWFPFGSIGLLYLDMLAPSAPELEQEMQIPATLRNVSHPIAVADIPAMYAGVPIAPGPAIGPLTWLDAPTEPEPFPCRREGGKCSCSGLGPCEATLPKSWVHSMNELTDETRKKLASIEEDVISKNPWITKRPWSGHPAGERGDWMQTASGRAFYPMDPRPAEIHIEDIAAALSKLCRYGGHSTRFYSVAEHCVLMSRVASPSVAFEALMHDASEAYLSDVIRPIKPFLSNYHEIEERLEQAIARRFDLQWPIPAEVKRLDNAILADECDQVMAKPPKDWRLPEPPLGVTLQFWTPEKAEYEFLASFARLRG